jgi:hypothetical protein
MVGNGWKKNVKKDVKKKKLNISIERGDKLT